MRFRALAAVAVCLVISTANLALAADAPEEAKCTKFLTNANTLYKFQASGHLARTERSNSCSFITGIGGYIPKSPCMKIFAADGSVIGKLGVYQTGGYPFRSRYYTNIGCSRGSLPCAAIARKAKRQGGTYEAFVQVDRVNKNGNRCFKINDMRGRTGNALH